MILSFLDCLRFAASTFYCSLCCLYRHPLTNLFPSCAGFVKISFMCSPLPGFWEAEQVKLYFVCLTLAAPASAGEQKNSFQCAGHVKTSRTPSQRGVVVILCRH